MRILRSQLPQRLGDILRRHESKGTTNSVAYEKATEEFYRRHLNRMTPWPEALIRALRKQSPAIYEYMWGPNEFTLTGILSKLDQRVRLRSLTVPALVIAGRYDEVRVETATHYSNLLQSSQQYIFEDSSHTPHLEESDSYIRIISRFMEEREAAAARIS